MKFEMPFMPQWRIDINTSINFKIRSNNENDERISFDVLLDNDYFTNDFLNYNYNLSFLCFHITIP